MKRARHADGQIIALLQGAQAGASIEDLCRRQGTSEGTCHKWKQKFGGLEVRDAQRLLEEENRKLKKLVADQALDNLVLKDCSEKNPKAQSATLCHDRSHHPLWAFRLPLLPSHRWNHSSLPYQPQGGKDTAFAWNCLNQTPNKTEILDPAAA